MEQSQALKKILKKWEGEFVSKNQRKPKKSDIDVAPEHIQDAYNKYNQLKKQKLNESSSLDAWSDSLNRTSTKDPATKVNDTGNKPSAGYLEKLGAKLFQNAKCLPQKQSNSHRKLNSLGNTTPSADKGGNSTPPIQSDSPFAEGGTFGKALLLSQKKSKGASNLLAEPLIPEPFRMREKSQLLQKKFQRAASMKACGTDSEACVMSDDRKTGELFLDESGNEDSAERDVVWKNDECDLADFRPISGLSSRTQTSQKVPFGSSESRIVPHSLIGLDQLHDSEVKSKDTFNFEDDLEADMEISPSKNKENFCLQQSDTTKSRTSKTTKMKRKVGDAESDDYCPTSKRTKLSEDFSSFEKSETSDYQEAQLQSTQLKAASVRVTSSKPMKTDNFVRLNMKTKGYKRKGKGMTGAQHKRLLWKNKMAARSSSRGDTCFKCGETGHWANKCPNRAKKQPHKFNFGDNPKLKKKKEEEEAEEEEEADFDLDLQFDIDGNVLPTSYEAPTAPPPTEPLVPPNHDGSLQELDDLVSRGLKMFGFSSFRAGQEKAVKRILSGLSTLVVLSTGAGKSLCYQLPAYLYAQRSKCITLVISPLISLMEDQIAGLPKGVKGACFHSNMTKAQREKVMSALEDGSLHFLLISPETIAGGGGGATHGGLINPAKLPPIAFVCIDEAHCLSEWSHHFRPSYLRLCKVLRERFGVRCFLGLTATATLSTAADVSRHLNITDFKEATIRGQPVPDNLKLSVSRDEDRDDALIQLLQGERMSKCASIIIYCTRRDQTDRLATLIRTCLKDSALSRDVVEEYASQNRAQVKAKGKVKRKADNLTWDAESYHAGLTSAQRLRVQNAFMSGRLRVVVATVAFGMGLDKSDVRAVIHYNMPKSFESYVQEIGRAGRDGKPAHCHLFLDQQGHDLCELRKHTFANTIDRFTVKRLLQKVFLPCRCREIHHRAECDKQAADFPDDDIDYNKLGEDNSGSDETSKVEITPCSTTVSANCEKDCGKEKVSANRICPGHERAIPIEPTVMELDVKEEGLATLMCYLELRSDIVVENLPPVYATCRLQCYGGPRQLQTVAQKCPPVGVTVARLKRDGAFDRATKELEFNVVELADSMGWDSGPVKRELKTLMWDFSASGPTKSGVMVEFSDLAFHLRAPGDLSDNERDIVLDELSQRVVRQERTELRQLNQLHTALTSVSHKAYWMCSDEVDLKRDRRLKSVIDEYFENQKPPEELLTEGDSDPEVDAATLSQLQADIRGFVNTYSTDHSLTARAIARVLHGIASPRFPALVWGRVRRYWRSYLHVDFNVVMNVARQTLLQLRS